MYKHYLLAAALVGGGLAHAHAQTLSDYDGDGIANDVDIDDDNDGIPDAVENPCEQTLAAATRPTPSTSSTKYTVVEEIYGDFGGFWKTTRSSVNPIEPNDNNRLVGFKSGARTYATGIANARFADTDNDGLADQFDEDGTGSTLTAVTPSTWIALQSTDVVRAEWRIEPPLADGNAGAANGATVVPSAAASFAPYLAFGERGLEIGYGLANIGATIAYTVTAVDPTKVGDGIADILLSQIAQPSANGKVTVSLRNADGTYIGTPIEIDYDRDTKPVGNYKLDLYNRSTSTAPIADTDRPLRFATIELGAFNATGTDPFADIAAVEIEYTAKADAAFVAINEQSFTGVCNPPDADADGIPDSRDLDSDNDGVPDVLEAGGADTDGDGRVDGSTDADGDGLADVVDNDATDGPAGNGTRGISTSSLLDTDNDGTTDAPGYDLDGDGIANHVDLDADGDGVPDVIEQASGSSAGTTDGRLASVTDAGSTPDGLDDGYSAAFVPTDTDGDGVPDYLDLDADNDGVLDAYEAVDTGAPGYGVLNGPDADGDGLADGRRNVDPTQTVAGAYDYLTTDADGDAFFDWAEGFDDDGDSSAAGDLIARAAAYTTAASGQPEASDYPTTDTDGDGIPDWLDNLNGPDVDENARPPFLDPNAGSAWVDANGNGVADLLDPESAFGQAKAPPTKSPNTSPDFRNANRNVAVPVTLISFGIRGGDCAPVAHWSVGEEIDLADYQVERSRDGQYFEAVATVSATGASHYTVVLDGSDELAYYRLRANDSDGSSEAFAVVSFEGSCGTAAPLRLSPNPTAAGVPSAIELSGFGETSLTVVDPLGRAVAYLRANHDGVFNLPSLAEGIYTVVADDGRSARLVVR